ncbi:MFS transporter [Burkholderia sp. AU42008]|uniref:MFS transporter n=1 Tax=unclassified Burkholderia TaxID=2613784 RepID=UPI001B9C5585|nr:MULTISPECIES: MFS transporter [unclassified Burkholderia]MBR8235333.1 MFS transporter [Burkholderia sp. AU32357]MBY4873767.1 MFS transporter [Burkholderia sp. AU42008]
MSGNQFNYESSDVHAPLEMPVGSGRRDNPLSLAAGLVCLVLIGVNLRPGIVSIGPLLASISQAFGLSHTEASLLTSIPDVLMGLLALPTPWLARRFGRDRVILAALFVLCAATLGRAFAGSVAQLLLSTAGVGAGLAVASALVGGFIKAAYPARVALAMGVYAAALSFGSAVSAAASSPLAAVSGSWRFGAGVWAIPCLLAIGAWVFIERRQQTHAKSASSRTRHYGLPLTYWKAWLIALFFACDNFLFYSLVTWIAPLYREHGVDEATAGLILASVPAVFVIATPFAGLFSRKVDRRPVLACFSAMSAVGLLGLAIAPYAAPFLLIPLISFGIAGGFVLGMTLPLDNTRDPEEANVWNAFIITVAYLIAATGPLLVGALRDRTGSFHAPLWLLAIVGAVMLALTPFLQPKKIEQPGF